MARFNEILVGRYARAMQKLMGIKGTVPTPVLSSEIQPIISLFRGAEDRYVESWDTFLNAQNAGPTVGNNNGFQIRNPVGSNVIIVMEQVTMEQDTTPGVATVSLGGGNPGDLLNLSNGVGIDSRGRAISTAILSGASNSPVPLASVVRNVTLAAGIDRDLIFNENQEIPLLPGNALRFLPAVVNVVSRIFFQWRERFLEEAERA